MKSPVSLSLTLSIICSCGRMAHAATLITDAGGNDVTLFPDTIGFSFLVGAAPLQVTQLGVWDFLGDGLQQPNTIGLWDEAGTLLASAGIPPGTSAPLVNGFRYSFIGGPPVVLNANTSYVLGSYANFENRIQGTPPATFSADATLIGTRRNDLSQFAFPSLVHGSFPGVAVVGPNMQYTVAPEPTVGFFLLSGGILLAARRRVFHAKNDRRSLR